MQPCSSRGQNPIDSLIPIASIVLEPNKANLTPVRSSGKTSTGTLSIADGISMLGDFHQLKLDLLDWRNFGDHLAQRVEYDLLFDHFLNLDHRLVGFLLPSPRRHLIEFLAARDLKEQKK